MSVKEWGSYAYVDVADLNPTRVWSQEYPWPVADLHDMVDSNHADIVLPTAIKDRLYGKNDQAAIVTLYPPSKLSLFGINFVAQASWVYPVADGASPIDQVTFDHTIVYYTGTHQLNTDKTDVTAQLDTVLANHQVPTQQIDLSRLALDPIVAEGPDNGAVVGFVKSQFYVPPDSAQGFGITSTANNLLVTGTDFQSPSTNDALMTADLNNGKTATMNVAFKILDDETDFTLFLKHWKTGDQGCILTITVNGSADAIVRHVDSLEAGSGSDNLMRVTLRSKDYVSNDYYDYLVPGLNTVTIVLAADDPASTSGCGYAIRALAIG
jgi:hypothetical protein